MKKKLIIFDLDNTLFRSRDSYKYILAEIIREKWDIEEDISVKYFEESEQEMDNSKEYLTIKDFYKEFNAKFLNKILDSPTEKNILEFSDILVKMKNMTPIKLKTYPGVKEVLIKLKERGYKLAILTGTWEKKIKSFDDIDYAKKKKEILEKLLDNSGLTEIIDKLFVTYEYATVKPNPKSFSVVLNHFNIDPEYAVMIGDKEADLLSINSGIQSILFDPDNRYSGNTKPEYKITDYSELISLIESYN